MYYEERIIDGVLHFRFEPLAEFRPFTAAELTAMLTRERSVRMDLQSRIN